MQDVAGDAALSLEGIQTLHDADEISDHLEEMISDLWIANESIMFDISKSSNC